MDKTAHEKALEEEESFVGMLVTLIYIEPEGAHTMLYGRICANIDIILSYAARDLYHTVRSVPKVREDYFLPVDGTSEKKWALVNAQVREYCKGDDVKILRVLGNIQQKISKAIVDSVTGPAIYIRQMQMLDNV